MRGAPLQVASVTKPIHGDGMHVDPPFCLAPAALLLGSGDAQIDYLSRKVIDMGSPACSPQCPKRLGQVSVSQEPE
jgi:hypothetical protein